MAEITPELVAAAYEAVTCGDREKTALYWSEDLRFFAPGSHAGSGWRVGLDDFLSYVQDMLKASGGSWTMQPVTLLINDEDGYSVDANKIHAVREALRRAAPPRSTCSTSPACRCSSGRTARWSRGTAASSATAGRTTPSGGRRSTATESVATDPRGSPRPSPPAPAR